MGAVEGKVVLRAPAPQLKAVSRIVFINAMEVFILHE